MTAQIVRKVRAGAPVPDDTAYHAPIDSISAPFTSASGPARAPRRRGLFDFRWLLVAIVLIAAGAGSFLHFFHP